MARQIFRERTGVEFTQNDVAFVGGTSSPAVVGQVSQVQLFNPVGSGVQLIVQRIRARAVGGTTVYSTATPLTTLTPNTFNKRVVAGASTAVGEVRTGSTASPSGGSKQGDVIEVIDTEIPAVLNPGFGINIEGQAVNNESGGLFEWIESAV